MNFLTLIFSTALLFSPHAIFAEPLPPSQPQAGPVEHVKIDWIKNGILFLYNAQGTGTQPPTSFVYSGPNDMGRISIDGNPERIVWMIRSEFPSSVSFEFIKKNIVSLLTGFGTRERVIGRDEVFEFTETVECEAPREAQREIISKLLDVPSISPIGDDTWSARYMTISGRSQIVMCVAEGRRTPFSIERIARYTLTEGRAETFTQKTLEKLAATKARAMAAEAAITSHEH